MEIPPPPYSEIVKTHDALSEKLTYGTYAQLPSSTLFKEMIYRMADGFGSMKTPSAPPESAMNFTKLPSAPPESALSLIKEPSAPLENSPTPMNQPGAAPPNLPSQMKPPSAPVLTPGSTPLPSPAPPAQGTAPQPAMAALQPALSVSAQPTAQPALVIPNPMGTHVRVPNNPTPPNQPGLPAAPVQNPAVAKPPTPNAEQQNTLGSSKPDPSPNSTEQIASPASPIAAPQGETAAAQTAHTPSVATVETIPTPSHPEVPGEASSFGPASASTQPVPRPQESMRNEPGAMTSPKENSKEAKAEEGAMNPSTNSTSSIRYSPPPGETQANAKPNGEPPQQTVLTSLPTPNSPAQETTHQGNMPLPQDTHTAPHQTAMGQTAASTQSNNFSQANPSMPTAQAANIPNTAVATPQLPSQPTSAPVPNTAPANTPTNVPGMPMAFGAQPRASSVPGSNSNVIVPYSSATTSSKSNSSSSTGFGSGVNHVESIKKAHDDDDEETEEWEEDDEEDEDEDEED